MRLRGSPSDAVDRWERVFTHRLNELPFSVFSIQANHRDAY